MMSICKEKINQQVVMKTMLKKERKWKLEFYT